MARGPFKWPTLAAAIVVIVALGLAAALVGIRWSIQSGVRDATAIAVREYPGDGVLALVTLVDAPEHSFAERNRAVWALGQLGDARATPTLESHYSGSQCDHTRRLCQHELKKAIDLIRSRAKR